MIALLQKQPHESHNNGYGWPYKGEIFFANTGNGGTKQLRTSEGTTLELTTPRDRSGSFEPEIVKKRQTILADSLESKIIGLYGLGMSLRDIAAHIKEMYDTDISHTVLSEVTDRVIPAIKLWQAHEFEDVYTIVPGCDVLQSKRPKRPCGNQVSVQCIRH